MIAAWLALAAAPGSSCAITEPASLRTSSRAFERFSQADASHGAAGSGLGLALVDVVARAHGGRASVSNRTDGGAEAVLVLSAA